MKTGILLFILAEVVILAFSAYDPTIFHLHPNMSPFALPLLMATGAGIGGFYMIMHRKDAGRTWGIALLVAGIGGWMACMQIASHWMSMYVNGNPPHWVIVDSLGECFTADLLPFAGYDITNEYDTVSKRPLRILEMDVHYYRYAAAADTTGARQPAVPAAACFSVPVRMSYGLRHNQWEYYAPARLAELRLVRLETLNDTEQAVLEHGGDVAAEINRRNRYQQPSGRLYPPMRRSVE